MRFNIPLSDELRGYAGFDKDHPAKSEYKRITNVWTDIQENLEDCVIEDISELFRPTRVCEKPIPLLQRLISTHSHVGDLVVDCFAGTGSTGVACKALNRRFIGCDLDASVIDKANERIANTAVYCMSAYINEIGSVP